MTGNLTQNVMQLSKQDRERLFQVLTDHADLLAKVIPNVPLLEYIVTGNTVDANNNAVIQAYVIWKTQS
jgi:protein gp37